MLNKILDDKIYKILTTKIDYSKINEIRIRDARPITVFYGGQASFLSHFGLSNSLDNAIIASKKMIEEIIFKASEFSIYSVNEELKQGFLVLDGGERIGVCGTVVIENNLIKTITNFTSVNIRIPHEIKNCSLSVFKYLFDSQGLKNILVISPPGQGKTTFIRDFVYQLSIRNLNYNILIIDERGEIAGKGNKLQIGNFCDILSFSDKQNGFLQGIRAMNPHLIVTDELGADNDFEAVRYASNCGVKILATIHADSIFQLKQKSNFPKIANIFERYIVLKKGTKPGVIEGVYNEKMEKILGIN
ncbi:MAG: hypothetical protein PHV79_00350 [Clostridia bacterium]|nr:hypothetical protein [Clostridia bacterium]